MAPALTAHALHVHCFALPSQDGYLARVAAAAHDLELQETEAPDAPITDTLFAKSPPGIFEAIHRRRAELTVVSVCLAPAAGTALDSWLALDARWRAAATQPGLDSCLLEIRVLYALHRGAPPNRHTLTRHLPVQGRLSEPGDLGNGVLLWEADTTDEAVRYLIVTAPRAHEAHADSWLWPSGDTTAPPLPRYLEEYAKARHGMRRLDGPAAGHDSHREWLHRHADALLELPDPAGSDELVRQARQRADALALTQAAIADTRLGLRAVLESLGLLMFTRAPEAARQGPLHQDLLRFTADLTSLSDRSALTASTSSRLDTLISMAERRLDRIAQEQVVRNSFAVVVQAAFIGALVVALSAIDAFSYPWRPHPDLRLPVIAAAAALALVLPLATAPAGPRRGAWRAAAELVLAAAATWAVTAAAAYGVWGRPAPVAATAGAVTAAVAAVAWWRFGRRRSRR
ncbi:CATRA conflict system CASPASE/TPR repeat-associated protein [Catellatospora sp. NPDC049111]|uniref:CATRA conflict system CASPASE/TPR repeat-associated protein n=1 Tax=Catellatospora sp. NPDC049111 TaxID=3155271 RepID=UPI0033C18B15